MPQSYRLTFDASGVQSELRRAAARGLLLGAEHVLGVSNDRVPLDEATLQQSGTASVDEGDLTAMVSYDTPYAVPQHERLDYRHAPGREAKYLENSLNSERAQVLALVAAELRRALR
ncbi:minor capsid protein [Streptomyces brasiliscabiei]|uniref:minor capsid protein n=1 Tax=Streptomyces brasiliscabiei TaxID=2736302 RepID=UPI001C0F7C81|nr:minor capsid protein [Streptomyces brasiliscabiei]